MTLLATINANGTTILMATHDSGIVDQMRRRVIELVSGHVVRDERSGGYQTQAVPVQQLDLDGSLAARGPSAATGLMPTVPVDAEADSGLVASELPKAPEPVLEPEPAPVAAAPVREPEPVRPVTTPIAVRPATPPAAAPAPARPAPQPAPERRPAAEDAPPPLVDPLAAHRERSA
jgi:cell division transport system ATP-binding protein